MSCRDAVGTGAWPGSLQLVHYAQIGLGDLPTEPPRFGGLSGGNALRLLDRVVGREIGP